MTASPTLPDANFSFGKHRGLLVSRVVRIAPGYLLWAASIRPTRADPRLWAAVKAHLPLAAELLEQRDQVEREELEARRARRLARLREVALRAVVRAGSTPRSDIGMPQKGRVPVDPHLGQSGAVCRSILGDSARDSRTVRIEDLV